MVHYIADRILVMYLGKIVEVADRARVWKQPLHPYTAGLLAAHPAPDPAGAHRPRVRITGDMPSPTNPPSGLPLPHPLPVRGKPLHREEPVLRALPDGRQVACHRVEVTGAGEARSPSEILSLEPITAPAPV